MDEIWKDVVGYEGLYQISSDGRVMSLTLKGKTRSVPLLLKQQKNWKGYLRVSLCKDGKAMAFSVHKLVMSSFVGSAPKGQNVDHIDGVKTNNSLSNLQYLPDRANTTKYHAERCKMFGTYRDKRRKARPWNAKIILNGKAKQLGVFETQEQAHAVYLSALKNHMEARNE